MVGPKVEELSAISQDQFSIRSVLLYREGGAAEDPARGVTSAAARRVRPEGLLLGDASGRALLVADQQRRSERHLTPGHRRVELERDLGGAAGRDLDGLGRGAVALVPGLDRVAAR